VATEICGRSVIDHNERLHAARSLCLVAGLGEVDVLTSAAGEFLSELEARVRHRREGDGILVLLIHALKRLSTPALSLSMLSREPEHTPAPSDADERLTEQSQRIGEKGGGTMAMVDARPIINGGGEPFEAIMSAVAALGADEEFVVLAPFEPVPLEGVLSSQGFAYEAVELGNGDWQVTFRRPS